MSTSLPGDDGSWSLLLRVSVDESADLRAFDVVPVDEEHFDFVYALHESGSWVVHVAAISDGGVTTRELWTGRAAEGVRLRFLRDGDVLVNGPSRQPDPLSPVLFGTFLLRSGAAPIALGESNQFVDVDPVLLDDGSYRMLVPNPGGYGDCEFRSRFVAVSREGALEATCLPRHFTPPDRWVPDPAGSRFLGGNGNEFLTRFEAAGSGWAAREVMLDHSISLIARVGSGDQALVQRMGGKGIELLTWAEDGTTTLAPVPGTEGLDEVHPVGSAWRDGDFCWFDDPTLSVFCLNPATRALARTTTAVPRKDDEFFTRRLVRSAGPRLFLFELNRTGILRNTGELWGRRIPDL